MKRYFIVRMPYVVQVGFIKANGDMGVRVLVVNADKSRMCYFDHERGLVRVESDEYIKREKSWCI